MKKILLFTVIVMALVLTLALTVSAEDVIQSGTWGDLTWELNETTGALIISGEGEINDFSSDSEAWRVHKDKIKSVTIEDGVTSIGNYAFEDCTGLTSVTIGSGVKTIGDYAFRYCTGLTSIEIPDSVTSIGSYAFRGCTGLTSITIHDSVTSIGSCAFQGCTGLTNISIPDSVTSIDSYAFSYCTGLTSIEIPDSLKSIGSYAFYECTGLTSIEIPNSVTSIGSDAFKDCTKLESITLPFVGATKDGTENTHFGYIFGAPTYGHNNSHINNKACYVPASLKTVVITGGTKIDDYAFYYCTGLTSVTIGSGVETIGDYAFRNCTGLTSIEIPDSVTSIGSSAFYGCTGLTNVTIGNEVETIGSDAFKDCTKLESITLPFVGATKDGTENTHFGYIFGASAYRDNKSYVPASLKTVVITGGTKIAGYAFYGCTGLTSITIPNSVTSIGYDAFYGCTGLTSVTIGNGVESIGPSAFYGCSSLTYTTYGNAKYLGNDINKYLVLVSAMSTSITSCTIHEDTKVICSNAFEDCTKLTSIEIPNSVTYIGSFAFSGCTNIKLVFIKSDAVLNKLTSSNSIIANAKSIVVSKGATVPQNVSTSFTTIYSALINEDESDIYSNHAHVWISEDCENGLTCSVCNVVTDTGEHTYDNACDTECNVCNAERTIQHTYDNACDASCNTCAEERTPSAHVWDAGTVTKEPTKKEEGVKTYTCTVCKETKTESIPMLTGCGGGGAMIALLTNTGIALVWFALKKRH